MEFLGKMFPYRTTGWADKDFFVYFFFPGGAACLYSDRPSMGRFCTKKPKGWKEDD